MWKTPVLVLATAAIVATMLVSSASADSAPELRLTVRPEPTEAKVGDEIIVELVVTNLGTTDFLYHSAGNDECALIAGFDLHFTAPDGKTERPPRGVASCLGGRQRLAPGASFHAHMSLNHRAGCVLSPGEYRLTGVYSPSRWSGSDAKLPEVVSPETVVTVRARTAAEMGAYIESLKAQLAGLQAGDKDASARYHLIRKLGYTGDVRVIPAVIDAMYSAQGKGGANGAREAFVDFLPDKSGSLRALLDAGKARGLADGEMAVILRMLGATQEEMYPLIERSLAPDSPATWQGGTRAAMASDDPDRFALRLVAIARTQSSPARLQALIALAVNRSEEGVKVLHEALEDPDPMIRKRTADAIRNTYLVRKRGTGRPIPGHPLLESDFDRALQE